MFISLSLKCYRRVSGQKCILFVLLKTSHQFFHMSSSASHDFVTARLQDRWSENLGGGGGGGGGGGEGGRTPLRIRVSTHPHTPKIRGGGGFELDCVSTHPHTPKMWGEGWSNFTAYPRIYSPTHPVTKKREGLSFKTQTISPTNLGT